MISVRQLTGRCARGSCRQNLFCWSHGMCSVWNCRRSRWDGPWQVSRNDMAPLRLLLWKGSGRSLSGRAPVSEMLDYPAEVQSYTGGRGRLALRLEGYYPCHNQEEVLADIGYDSEEMWTTRPVPFSAPMGQDFSCHGIRCRITCTSKKNSGRRQYAGRCGNKCISQRSQCIR